MVAAATAEEEAAEGVGAEEDVVKVAVVVGNPESLITKMPRMNAGLRERRYQREHQHHRLHLHRMSQSPTMMGTQITELVIPMAVR